jgi:hypothetical protein
MMTCVAKLSPDQAFAAISQPLRVYRNDLWLFLNMMGLQNHLFWLLHSMPEILNDGRHAGYKCISFHNLMWLSMTPLNEIPMATPSFRRKWTQGLKKRIQFNITGNRQCNMADAKQVIISKLYINVENISLLLNKVATKFQRLSYVLKIIEVQDTKRKLPILSQVWFQVGSH